MRRSRRHSYALAAAGALALLLLTPGGALDPAYSSEIGGSDASITDGQRLFTKGAVPPCGLCHAMKHAGATGEIGPSLDELKPDAHRVATAIRNGIGQMPTYTNLSEQEINAIAHYVARFSGAN